MPALRRLTVLFLLAALLAAATGCGNPPDTEESRMREEVDSSLRSLEDTDSYRYHLDLETWIGVSGQSVYGSEKGEGSYLDGDFSVSIERSSPAGDESLELAFLKDLIYLQQEGVWSILEAEEALNPLYDPLDFIRLVSTYGSIIPEGEEELDGRTCRRYLLQLGGDRSRDTMSELAWSYYSNLTYELNCRIWIGEASEPPASMRLEVVGFDPQESLQRYRLLATLEPYDLDAPDIQPTGP